MKNIKYTAKKEVNGETNKASRTRPHACPVLAACRVACCPLPACSASPFATLSAGRIGYVECPFNGLNTHTQSLERRAHRILLQTF